MPKWRLRPPGLPASKSPAPAKVSVVLVDGPRSAEPPISQGMFCASTFSTLPDASRPAMPLASAGKLGRLRSQPAGSSRRCIWSSSAASSGNCLRYAANSASHAAARLAAARADAGGEVLADAVGHEELRVLRPAVGALGELDFLVAQRLAVGRGGVLLVRRAVADVAVEDDQRRPALGLPEDLAARARCASRSLASPTRSTFQP